MRNQGKIAEQSRNINKNRMQHQQRTYGNINKEHTEQDMNQLAEMTLPL
jgi:hypothetical protein